MCPRRNSPPAPCGKLWKTWAHERLQAAYGWPIGHKPKPARWLRDIDMDIDLRVSDMLKRSQKLRTAVDGLMRIYGHWKSLYGAIIV